MMGLCPDCSGRGSKNSRTCLTCKGHGLVELSSGARQGRVDNWGSSSPSFNDKCLAYIELIGEDELHILLEPFTAKWGDRSVPKNVQAQDYSQVYKSMASSPIFLEGLMRTGRRGLAMEIIQEAAK